MSVTDVATLLGTWAALIIKWMTTGTGTGTGTGTDTGISCLLCSKFTARDCSRCTF
jgi:hypothetical protein